MASTYKSDHDDKSAKPAGSSSQPVDKSGQPSQSEAEEKTAHERATAQVQRNIDREAQMKEDQKALNEQAAALQQTAQEAAKDESTKLIFILLNIIHDLTKRNNPTAIGVLPEDFLSALDQLHDKQPIRGATARPGQDVPGSLSGPIASRAGYKVGVRDTGNLIGYEPAA